MKLLVVLAAVALLVWLLGGKRRAAVRHEQKTAPRVAGPEEMVRCAACGLHLPAMDAFTGRDGRVFCSEEHRRDAA